MAKKDNFWTDKNVKTLTTMWNQGKTAADIMEVLGDGATRNSVIGKANRLGLEKRPSPIKKNAKAKVNTATKKEVKEIIVVDDSEKAFSILDIKEGMCRWPTGDPKEEGFHFCGEKAVDGCSYCENHASQAYQVPTQKKRRR